MAAGGRGGGGCFIILWEGSGLYGARFLVGFTKATPTVIELKWGGGGGGAGHLRARQPERL
jgi:hypothetical protein